MLAINIDNPIKRIFKVGQFGTSKGDDTKEEKRDKTGEDNLQSDSVFISGEGLEKLYGVPREQTTISDPGLTADGKTAIEKLDELIEKKKQEEREKKALQEQADAANDTGDTSADQAKLLEVARRIASGDKVPAKDERKLMEYNPKLYQAAKAAAMVNISKKHKKYDSLFDEDESGNQDQKLRDLEDENFENQGAEKKTVENSESLSYNKPIE